MKSFVRYLIEKRLLILSLLLGLTGIYQMFIVLSSVKGLILFSQFAGWNHTLNDIIFPWLWSNFVFTLNAVAALILSYQYWSTK